MLILFLSFFFLFHYKWSGWIFLHLLHFTDSKVVYKYVVPFRVYDTWQIWIECQKGEKEKNSTTKQATPFSHFQNNFSALGKFWCELKPSWTLWTRLNSEDHPESYGSWQSQRGHIFTWINHSRTNSTIY